MHIPINETMEEEKGVFLVCIIISRRGSEGREHACMQYNYEEDRKQDRLI